MAPKIKKDRPLESRKKIGTAKDSWKILSLCIFVHDHFPILKNWKKRSSHVWKKVMYKNAKTKKLPRNFSIFFPHRRAAQLQNTLLFLFQNTLHAILHSGRLNAIQHRARTSMTSSTAQSSIFLFFLILKIMHQVVLPLLLGLLFQLSHNVINQFLF